MNFKIWIGVDDHGRPLVGAAAINAANERGELHDVEHVYPSQLRYRIAAFYPVSDSDSAGGYAPLVEGDKQQRLMRGRWCIRTRTDARADRDRCVNVRGLDNPDHEFPRADHEKTTRRKVSP